MLIGVRLGELVLLGGDDELERLCDLGAAHPEATICAIASSDRHLTFLSEVAADRALALDVRIDLDVGMHRTGVAPGEEAQALYRAIDRDSHLQAAGFHVYDGHEHVSDPTARAAAAERHIADLQQMRQGLEASGVAVPHIVGGGSFSFAYYARTQGMKGSPGTGVYWDSGYAGQMPDMPFQFAALILTQVVDAHAERGTITTDLGYKGISADLPLERRVRLMGHEESKLLMQNEEHAVFDWSGERPEVGTYLLAVPGHVCPTTIRYPGSYVVDPSGAVVDYYPHTARDRQ